MLPKPSKDSKKFSSEQLDFVETISDADKTKKKRSLIIILLFFTVGISLCFWFYRQFKNFTFPQIKIPTLSQPKFSPTVPQNWSLFVQTIGTTNFSYSSNFASQSAFTKITAPHNPSYAKKYLPDGVSVFEKTNSTSDFLEILSQISTPKIKFQVYAKIPGNINYTSPEVDTFSKLVEIFYWHLLK